MCNYCNGFGCIHCLPPTDTCPECEGKGNIYYLWDKEKGEDIHVPYEEYKKFEGTSDAVFEPCPHCDGDGWVVVSR